MRSPASLLLEIGTVMTFPARPAHRIKAARRQRWISLTAFLILVGAWLFGYVNTRDSIAPSAASVLPGAVRIEPRGALFAGYDSAGALVGYAAASSAPGYGGPVMLLVGVNPDGAIIGVQVVTHRETPGFFRVLERDQYYEQFLGQTPADNLTLGQGIDGVSGATLSAEAVAQSIRDALRTVAGQELGVSMPPDEIPVKFGAPEIVLIGLFIAGFFAHRTRHKHAKKWLRWGTLITGMIALGFIYNKPFTVAHVTSFLAGYWPDWRTNLYWFLLLGGILFVTSAQGKNPYCSWFCPFGAVQECLGKLSGAKVYRPRRLNNLLNWLQRGLAFSAIFLGLAFRQPAAASYEPFGTLFDLTGSWPQWVLLVLVLLASLVIHRPFCNYLCPLDPVVGYIGEIRRWVKESRDSWLKRRQARA